MQRDQTKVPKTSRGAQKYVLLLHLPSSLHQQNPQQPVHGSSEHSLYTHMYAMHTFTTKPAIHSTCCPNQDTATHRVSAWTRPKTASGSSMCTPKRVNKRYMPTDTCQLWVSQLPAPLHSPSMDMRNSTSQSISYLCHRPYNGTALGSCTRAPNADPS